MIKRYLTSLVYGLSIGLFCSFSAMATVCFLPDGSCGGVNYGYKDESGSTCTYKTRDEANLKKGECEEVQKRGFCFYLACSMSKSDCDKAAENAPNHDKCCVPCGNCWKVDDCSIPDIPTCTGAGYETEQTCKNQNLNFKPNGKFDKNGTACGTCEDGPTPRPCSFWNTLSQTYMTEDTCKKQGGIFHPGDVKDSDNNICGTCDSSVNCPSGYEPAATADCDTSKGFYRYTSSNYPNCIQCQCRNQGIINGYCTNCSAEGYEPRSSLPPGLDCNIQCPLDSSYVKADKCTETPCPTGYTRGLTSIHMCSYQNGQSATSIEYNGYSGAAPCGKCVYEECTPKDCGAEYRYVKSSFTSMDNTEECNPGCDGIVKYKCADGYTFTANSGSRYCKKDTPDCDGITRFKNVTYNMVMNMNKICQGGIFVHDDKCYYCGKSCAQLYAGAKNKCEENETATGVGQDEAGNSCYTCECNKTLTSGKIANGSTVYYYGYDMPTLTKGCPSEMTLNVACKYFKDGKQLSSEDYSAERITVLYINGAHNSEIPSQPDLVRHNVTEYSDSVMTCSGCANVTCTFKYGGNKVSVSTTVEWGGYYMPSWGGYYQLRER